MLLRLSRCYCTKRGGIMKVLNVAEKNDAAKSLATIMSNGQMNRREGFSRFNKIYEFDYNLMNQRAKMVFTSVSGHLLGLEFLGQNKKWYGCDPVSLFDAPVEKFCPDNFKDIKRTLEREVRGCQKLVIWTDCDREGENIGFEVIQVCQAVKPNIPVFRARFSEITPRAAENACRNLIAPDKNTSDAVDVRQELDLRIGAAFTRFQTLRLQKVFPNVLADQLISYGSCQFPTLGFVVERYKQVQAFVAEPFWKLHVSHETEDGTVDFSWDRVRLFDHLACLVLYEHVIEDPVATVVHVAKKPKSKWRPVALDTVELEKLASRKLRISAKETMKIAEKLYTSGFISYPRTETNIFPKDLNLTNLVEQQTHDQNWGNFAQRVLNDGVNPRSGKKTDQAHPPIHPTKYTDNLQGNEKRIYEFIVRHFLACCSKDAQGEETTVEIVINDEKFKAQGLMIIAKNYLDVYPYEKWNAKIIPVFSQGDTFHPTSIQMNDGETSPPSLLTEADLIALMEKHGIGTDATHAEHIETIKSRLYVGVRDDGKFLPGELGMGLVEGYDEMGYQMSKPHLRSELEADLKRICDGVKDKNVVLRAQVQKYKEVFIEAVQQANKIDSALSVYFGDITPVANAGHDMPMPVSVKKCPKCGSDMTLREKKDKSGFYIGCQGYPSCQAAHWFPPSVLRAEVLQDSCSQCSHPVKKIKFKFKKGSMPPYIPLEYETCIDCDRSLQEVIGLKPILPSTGNQRGNVGQNTNPPRSNSTITQTPGRPPAAPKRNYSTQNQTQDRQPLGRVVGNNPTINNFFNNNNQPNSQPSNRNGNRSLLGPPIKQSQPDDPDEQGIVCNCGLDAPIRTVRKEGPNTGRSFYSCSKPIGQGCGFFLWADESETNSMSSKTSSGTEEKSASDKGEAVKTNIKCSCKDPVKKFTSKKEGPNKGREFYACSKPKGDGCNYFTWVDQADEEDDGVLKCRCGKPAKEMMVKKEGPNKGRKYHGCPSGWGKSCGFFKWIDDDPACLNADENALKCGCGLGAKAFTSKKEGPNKGRQFYSCSRPKGKGCNFFEWADDVKEKDDAKETKEKTSKKRASTGGDENAAAKKKK